jgi:hypothetical protein
MDLSFLGAPDVVDEDYFFFDVSQIDIVPVDKNSGRSLFQLVYVLLTG